MCFATPANNRSHIKSNKVWMFPGSLVGYISVTCLSAGRPPELSWKACRPAELPQQGCCCLTQCHLRGTKKQGHHPGVSHLPCTDTGADPEMAYKVQQPVKTNQSRQLGVIYILLLVDEILGVYCSVTCWYIYRWREEDGNNLTWSLYPKMETLPKHSVFFFWLFFLCPWILRFAVHRPFQRVLYRKFGLINAMKRSKSAQWIFKILLYWRWDMNLFLPC